MTTRRDVLRGTGAVMLLSGVAGCLGGNDDSTDGEDASDNETDEESNFPDENERRDRNDTDSDGELNEGSSENETGGEGEENDTDGGPGNESNETDETEEDRVPDKNETEPDRDQYEQQEEREIVELPEDTVDVELQAEQMPESDSATGGLRLHGSVTNTSDQYVDTVDLDLSIYDENEEYIGADIITVGDLDPDESADVDRTISAYDLQGQPDSIEIDKMVYGPE